MTIFSFPTKSFRMPPTKTHRGSATIVTHVTFTHYESNFKWEYNSFHVGGNLTTRKRPETFELSLPSWHMPCLFIARMNCTVATSLTKGVNKEVHSNRKNSTLRWLWQTRQIKGYYAADNRCLWTCIEIYHLLGHFRWSWILFYNLRHICYQLFGIWCTSRKCWVNRFFSYSISWYRRTSQTKRNIGLGGFMSAWY